MRSRWRVQRGKELSEVVAASLAGHNSWFAACAGMTWCRACPHGAARMRRVSHALDIGACRGAKPLCVVCHSPFSKGGHRGIGSGMRWAQPTLRWIHAPRASSGPLLSAIGARRGGIRAAA